MLTDLFIRRAKEALPEIEIVTPSEPDRRGGQVTLRHAEGRRISTTLRRRHRIIRDFRAPDLLRFSPVALYNSAGEVDQAIEALRETLDRREYLEISDLSSRADDFTRIKAFALRRVILFVSISVNSWSYSRLR